MTDIEIFRDRIMIPGPAGEVVAGDAIIDLQIRLAVLEAIASPPSQAILSGRYYGPLSTLSGYPAPVSSEIAANRLYAVPFYVPQDAAFDVVGFTVTTAVAGATVRMGLYGLGSPGLAGSLIADFGTVDASAAGFRSVTIATTLPRGLCWLVGAANVAGVWIDAVPSTTGTSAIFGHSVVSGSSPRAAFFRSTDLAPGFTSLPATFGAGTTRVDIPVFWMRAQ